MNLFKIAEGLKLIADAICEELEAPKQEAPKQQEASKQEASKQEASKQEASKQELDLIKNKMARLLEHREELIKLLKDHNAERISQVKNLAKFNDDLDKLLIEKGIV